MNYVLAFGEFCIKTQREILLLRKLAKMAKISSAYMCSMEKDRDPAQSEDILKRMVQLPLMTEEETVLFLILPPSPKKRLSFRRICRNT